MRLIRYKDKDGKTIGWSESDTIGVDIDGVPADLEWVEVEGNTKDFFKKPKDFDVKKEKIKFTDRGGKKREKDIYKFSKKSKK